MYSSQSWPLVILIGLLCCAGCGRLNIDPLDPLDASSRDALNDLSLVDIGMERPDAAGDILSPRDAGADSTDAGLTGLCAEPGALGRVPFASGDGGDGNPYIICSEAQLRNIESNLNLAYRIGADIELVGEPFSFGADDRAFTGKLNGAGHTISGFTNMSAGTGFAMFVLLRGLIRNLVLERVMLLGEGFVAGLVETNEGTLDSVQASGSVTVSGESAGILVVVNRGLIEDCSVAGTVAARDVAGGLASDNGASGIVRKSSSSVRISALPGGVLSVGGSLLGGNEGLVEQCIASGDVVGNWSLGGLIGNAIGGTVSRSWASGSTSGQWGMGGLVGRLGGDAVIEDCFATGRASGENWAGGLVGRSGNDAADTPRIARSYATGRVQGAGTDMGGLAGELGNLTVDDSYWDTVATTRATSAGSPTTDGKTPAEMAVVATYVGWDFMSVWLPPGGGPPQLRR